MKSTVALSSEQTDSFMETFGTAEGEAMLCQMYEKAIKAIGDSTKHGECWVYPHTSEHGYALVTVAGKKRTASRLVLCCATKKPLEYKEHPFDCCHRTPLCRFRSCINPDHLFWDTRAENIRRRETERQARELAALSAKGLIPGAAGPPEALLPEQGHYL